MLVPDRNKMQYLAPNTAAPFAQFRGYAGAVRGMAGLGEIDFGSAIDNAISSGLSQVDGYITQRVQGNTSPNVHIAAQNQAVADMGKIIDLLAQLKATNKLTVAVITQAENGIRAIGSRFSAFARQIGSARALQGARDIDNLVANLIADREREKAALGGGVVVAPSIDPVTGQVIYTSTGGINSIMPAIQQYLPMILLGIAVVTVGPQLFKKG